MRSEAATLLCDIIFYIRTGQSELLHFYSLTPSEIYSNPSFIQNIKQRGSSCDGPTRTAVREMLITHLITVQVVLPENVNVFLSRLLHQVGIRETSLRP